MVKPGPGWQLRAGGERAPMLSLAASMDCSEVQERGWRAAASAAVPARRLGGEGLGTAFLATRRHPAFTIGKTRQAPVSTSVDMPCHLIAMERFCCFIPGCLKQWCLGLAVSWIALSMAVTSCKVLLPAILCMLSSGWTSALVSLPACSNVKIAVLDLGVCSHILDSLHGNCTACHENAHTRLSCATDEVDS